MSGFVELDYLNVRMRDAAFCIAAYLSAAGCGSITPQRRCLVGMNMLVSVQMCTFTCRCPRFCTCEEAVDVVSTSLHSESSPWYTRSFD